MAQDDIPELQNTRPETEGLIASSFYRNSPEKSHHRRDDSVLYRHFTRPDILAYENLLHVKSDL